MEHTTILEDCETVYYWLASGAELGREGFEEMQLRQGRVFRAVSDLLVAAKRAVANADAVLIDMQDIIKTLGPAIAKAEGE